MDRNEIGRPPAVVRTIDDVVNGRHDTLPSLEVDPFDHPEAVDGANLSWVHYDAIRGVLAILLDLRVSLGELGDADTALVVAHECREVRISPQRAGGTTSLPGSSVRCTRRTATARWSRG